MELSFAFIRKMILLKNSALFKGCHGSRTEKRQRRTQGKVWRRRQEPHWTRPNRSRRWEYRWTGCCWILLLKITTVFQLRERWRWWGDIKRRGCHHLKPPQGAFRCTCKLLHQGPEIVRVDDVNSGHRWSSSSSRSWFLPWLWWWSPYTMQQRETLFFSVKGSERRGELMRVHVFCMSLLLPIQMTSSLFINYMQAKYGGSHIRQLLDHLQYARGLIHEWRLGSLEWGVLAIWFHVLNVDHWLFFFFTCFP